MNDQHAIDLLHELVRMGEKAVTTGVEQMQHGLDRLVQASIDRLAPVRKVREEMAALRSRLEQLESSLSQLETDEAKAPETVVSVSGKEVGE